MPPITSVHTNRPLTNVAIGHPVVGLIGTKFLLPVKVKKKSDKYFIFDANRDGIRPIDDRRAPGSIAKEVDYKLTTDTYDCGGHSLSHLVTDEERENVDAPLKPDIDTTEHVVGLMNTIQEIELVAALVAALTGARTSAIGNLWSNETTGTPIADIILAQNAIESATGFTPNVMAMDSQVFRQLVKHPDITDLVKHMGGPSDPAKITRHGIASLFELDEVLVAKAPKNTAKKGQTASLSRIWGVDVYLGYRPLRAGLKIPALGYNFAWMAGPRGGWHVEKWREKKRKGDMINVEKYRDHKITFADAGYRLTTAI